MLLDIHTHHLPHIPGESIFNVTINDFQPLKGHYYSIGLHPWQITKSWESDFNLLRQVATHPAILAIGEAGMDRFTTGNVVLQKVAFERQILLSEELRKPLIIHCVKCFNELIQLKRKYRPLMPWVVHGFRNNPFIAEKLLNEDIFLSFGERYQASVLQIVPKDKLFVETDESIQSIRGIIQGISNAICVDPTDLGRQIAKNVQGVFFNQ